MELLEMLSDFARHASIRDDRYSGADPVKLCAVFLCMANIPAAAFFCLWVVGLHFVLCPALKPVIMTIFIGQNVGLVEICKYMHSHLPPRRAHRNCLFALYYNILALTFSVSPLWQTGYNFFEVFDYSVRACLLINFAQFIVCLIFYLKT